MIAKETVQRVQGAPRQVATDHPNATTGATAGALATVLCWVFTVPLGMPMDAPVGAAVATLFGTVALFIGKRAPWWRRTEEDPALLDADPDNPP